MAWLGLVVPPETGRILESVEVPGQREKASDMHVTVLYMGDVPVDVAAAGMVAAVSVAKLQAPFLCACDSVDSFPPNPEYGIPVIAPVIAPAIHDLHAKLVLAFDAAGLPYSKKFPEFKPHVTLARNLGQDAKPYSAPLPGQCSWVASELFVWGGENGSLFSARIPFVLGPDILSVAASKISSMPPWRP